MAAEAAKVPVAATLLRWVAVGMLFLLAVGHGVGRFDGVPWRGASVERLDELPKVVEDFVPCR